MLVSVKKGIDNKLVGLKKRKTPQLTAKFFMEVKTLHDICHGALEHLEEDLNKANKPFFFPKTREKVEVNVEVVPVLNKKAIVESLISQGRIDDLLSFVDFDHGRSLEKISGGKELIASNSSSTTSIYTPVIKKMTEEEMVPFAPKPKKVKEPAAPAATAKKAAGPIPKKGKTKG